MYLYYSILVLISAVDLTGKFSVKDVLFVYSMVYIIDDRMREKMSEVPASVEKLKKMLGTNLFPK
jgi:hypothetical protein